MHDDRLPGKPYIPGTTKSLGDGLFGPADVPKRYRCSQHGIILAAEVLWKRDQQPYCPECGELLKPLA